jgi:uncharacterized DUF497 family protein
MLFEFDPAKDRKNIDKHGIGLARFADMAEDTYLSAPDVRQAYGEERWIIYGLIDGVLYCAVVTYRNDHTRIVSLRRASRRERNHYAKAQG